jgi:lysozyme family protein
MDAYSRAFERAVNFVLRPDIEGGYVNDPNDTGGETKYGISKASYPQLDIPTVTRDDAKRIYFRDYWSPLRLDMLPARVALAVFDGAVSQGTDAAARMLQMAVGAVSDGIIGPETITKTRQVDEDEALAQVFAQRALRYAKTKGFDRFGRGWSVRLFKACTEAAR